MKWRHWRLPAFALLVWGVSSLWVHHWVQHELASALATYRASAALESREAALNVESALGSIYSNIRTISMLPSVRKIDRHGKNLDADDRETMRQIYFNLRNDVDVSEVYLVSADLDPDKIDSATREPQVPILSFDGYVASRPHQQVVGGKIEPAHAERTAEEVEIQEYRQLRDLMRKLKGQFPTNKSISGLDVPMYTGPPIITCDNTLFNQTHLDKDRTGRIFSVPFFDDSGVLKGTVSVVILDNALQLLLPESNYVLIDPESGQNLPSRQPGQQDLSKAAIAHWRADAALYYSAVLPIKVPGLRANFLLWSGHPKKEFEQSPAVNSVRRMELVGYSLSSAMSLALFVISIYLVRGFSSRERKHEDQIAELRKRSVELERLTTALTDTKQDLDDAHKFARIGVFEFDLVTGIPKWSDQMFRLLGYEPNEVAPSIEAFRNRLDPEDAAAAANDIRLVREQGKPFEGYRHIILPDGETRILHSIMNLRRDEAGNAVKLIGTFQDVSEREEFREALQQHGQFLRDVLDSMSAFVAIFLPDGTLVETNRAFREDIGLKREDVVGKPFFESYWWSSSEKEQEVVGASLKRAAQGEVVSCEFEVRVANNKFVIIEGAFSPIRDSKGTIRNIVASGVDMTDRIAAEQLLRETKRQLEDAERIAEIGSWEVNLKTNEYIWSDNLYRIYGYEPHEVEPGVATLMKQIHPDDVKLVQRIAMEANERLEPFETVHRIIRRDGSVRFTQAMGRTFVDSKGIPILRAGVVRDVTEMRNAQTALVESRDMLSGILNIAPEATIVADKHLKVVMFSAGAAKTFGYKSEEIIGSHINRLIPARFHERHGRHASKFAGSPELSTLRMSERTEVLALRKNGEEFPAEASLSKLETAQGPIFTVVLRDVSAEKASRAALMAAQQAAEAASRAKSDFLANMSHEIRTPMNGVLGMSGLLLDTVLSPEQHEWVEIIRKSGENLLEIINDILDFSKIEAGKLFLDPVPFDLAAMVRELTSLFSFKVQEKGIELVVDLAMDMPRTVIGDPVRLRQILLNLVGNAIKFTERGHILIRVFASHEAEGGLRLFFEVEDTGIGIPPEKTALIFEKFSQAEESTTRKFGGTGLGLTISSKLVAMMNGKITVTSELGVGSVFAFDALVAEGPKLEPSRSQVSGGDLKGLRALVVDDPTLHQKILRGYLGAWEMRCDVAPSAERALQMIEEAAGSGDPFQFALGDFRGADIGKVRGALGAPDTKFIMITGFGQLVTSAELAEKGFSGLFVKPVFPDEIKACLQILWDAHENAKAMPFISRHYLSSKTQSGGAKAAATANIFTGAKVLVVEDMKVNLMLVTKILRKHGCEVFSALNGREAVDMMRESEYAVVFMDCQMPEMDGFEATGLIREREKQLGGHTAIIALTADAMTGDREKCLRAGMDDYLNKPIKADQITEMLRKWVPKSAIAQPAAETAELDPVV